MGLRAENVEDEIVTLITKNDWKSLLDNYNRNKFLPWIWPSLDDLLFIAKCVADLGAVGLVSIGCGSGLLEWLLQQATGLTVKAVEVDRSWWTSKHCTAFLPLEFAHDFSAGYSAAADNEALLFCYFNNEPAFLDYLKKFHGRCLIVIGPGENRGTHTAPNPFRLPEKVTENWKLYARREVSSENDFISIFHKK